MDTARDLASAALWQQSLERSLARRGKPTRSSPELYRLRPERDLVYGDFIRESAMYSQLRRSARSRPSMALPSAGGISALALLAATTLPSLLGGRGGAGESHQRLVYPADARAARLRRTPVTLHAAAAQPATFGGVPAPATAIDGIGAAPAPATAIDGIGAAPARGTVAGAVSLAQARTHAQLSSLVPASQPPTHRHTALAYDASTAGATSGGVAHAVSGGAAPPSPTISAAAPRVPVSPQPSGHPRSGGATVQERAAISALHPQVKPTTGAAVMKPATHAVTPATHLSTHAHPRTTAATTQPHAATQLTASVHPHPVAVPKAKPVTTPGPVAVPKPTPVAIPKPKPIPRPKPVATTGPARPAPAPTPTVATGHYVNPLADASVTPERIDQGVDYAGSGTLTALGAGRVTYVGLSGTGWPGAFIEYQLTDGPDSGRYVYYAEGVSPAGGLHVGETVQSGQPVAQIIPGSPTGIEIGWGSGVGTQTLAEADGDWSGGDDADSVPSPQGKDFSALIASLGGPPGKIEG